MTSRFEDSCAPRVSVVIVVWNGLDYVKRCLASLASQEPHELIVVDNGSTDGTRELLEKQVGSALIKLDNPGFGAANNAAAKRARGGYLLFLNSDCELGPDAIGTLATILDRSPGAWLAAPRLRSPDGRIQRSVGRAPTLFTEFLNKSMLHRVLPLFTYGRWNFTGDRPVDWATGACMMVRADSFKQIGGFDEGFFMFMEDVDLCVRLRAAGGELRFTDAAWGVHHGGASSNDVTVKARMLIESERASRRYFRKHHGEAAVACVRTMTALTATARFLLGLVGAVIPSYRRMGLARVRAYPLVIRDAVTRDPLPSIASIHGAGS
jgi:N-acetylglucosaminyl-diphospho-decaprenol L-rhamnosyltransferase